MNKEQAIDYIHSLRVFGSRPGLERITALMRRVRDDWAALPCVHIAGTSGKGSTAAILASVLRAQGYRTGLFTSPSILDFEERIQIDFAYIDDSALGALTAELKAHADALYHDEGLPVTEFEFVTALGLLYFTRRSVDVAVIEAGLGGRVDSTNIITPRVSVITPVSLDHTEILGDTITQIAREKAGIIKPGVPVVTGAEQHPDALAVITEAAARQGSRLTQTERTALTLTHADISGSRFVYRGEDYALNLSGEHQVYNALTALTAAHALQGFPVSSEAIRRGLAAIPCHGRLELLSERPLCLIDAAHNRAKIDALAAAVDRLLSGKRLVTVFGMSSDKDYSYCTQVMAGRSAAFLAFDGFHGRNGAVPAERLAELAAPHCPRCEAFHDLNAAIQTGRSIAGADGVLLVTGSMYFIGEAKKMIDKIS